MQQATRVDRVLAGKLRVFDAPMARAIWKAVIRFGGVSVPVKLYSAVQEQAVHFRLLHEKDREPVRQHMVNPVTGKVVPTEEIRRGIEVERGEFVLIGEDELEALEPEASRDIEITRFVPATQIDHLWYDRPYYLGPDGRTGGYFALARVLGEQDRIGVARWVMRNRFYAGALCAGDDHLMLITLRSASEIVPAEEIEAPRGRALDQRELRMAKQLVGALEDEFDPSAYRDEFRERVLELVHAKAKGRKAPRKRGKRRAPARKSLADELEASLKQTGGRRKAAA